MLAFALLLASAPADAEPVVGPNTGDFPLPAVRRSEAQQATELVRAPRMDRARFGPLPIRFSFASEILDSVEEVAVLAPNDRFENTGPKR